LTNYYEVNFNLIQHCKYSLSEIEEMIPWEREIYLGLLQQHIKEEKTRQEQDKARQRVG